MKYAAYVATTYGEVYTPIFERLEAELVSLRKRRSPLERARSFLDAYTLDGGLKAIR